MSIKVQRAWGRTYSPDKRDMLYRLDPKKSQRTSRSWRLGDITDQGNSPSCVGHAWCSWLKASPIRQHPILPDGIYIFAQYCDEWEGEKYEGTSVRGAAKVLQITGHISTYSWAWTLAPAINHLLEIGPLVIGVNWYEGMENTDKRGFIHVKGKVLGGHAVLLYGVDLNKNKVSIRNSWGTNWGLKGNCYLSIDDFNRLLSEDGECCTAQEATI